MKRNCFFLLLLIFSSCQNLPESEYPLVSIETKFGDIILEIYDNKAPVTAGSFLSYVDQGFYKRSHFYRILNDYNQPSSGFRAELIQGGIYRSNRKISDTLSSIAHEPTSETGILHKHGTISMARGEPGSAKTEFFICIGDQPGFDFGGVNNADGQGYAAFGRVIKGADVLMKIYRQPFKDDNFYPPVAILNIKRLK